MKNNVEDVLPFLESALALTQDGVIIVNDQGYLLFMNRAGRRLLRQEPSYDKPFLEQTRQLNLHHIDGRPMLPEETPLARALREESEDDILLVVRGGDDLDTYLSVAVTPVRDKTANLVGAIAICVDITERRQMEEALRASEQKFDNFVWNTEDGIALIDEYGTVIEWNRGQERITGLKRDQALGRPMWDVQFEVAMPERRTPEVYEQLKILILRLASGADWPRFEQLQERELQRVDGSVRTVQVSLLPIRTDKGHIIGSITRDITETKQAEERYSRAQRMEMAGRIAGQVAHDFNNLLSPLVGYPDLIKRELPEDHPAVNLCDTMLEAAEQMVEINDDLLALSRRGHFNLEPVSLNELVGQAISQMQIRPGTFHLKQRLAADLLPVKGSAAQLTRVISNLLANAREAMENAGSLEISTDNFLVKESADNRGLGEGGYVRLRVIDTGPGITEEIKRKMFDPFFSTKRADRQRGSGLGLSVVQAVVEDHKGYVTVESELGKGTAISVYLPADHERTISETGSTIETGSETILIVDDDELQLDVTSRLLRSQGYRVETAGSGEEAVSLIAGHPVDLVILDMAMPGAMDGTETFRRILEIRPEQRAIIMSGFAETDRVQEAQVMGAGTYLRKPVTLSRLAQAVRQELDRKAPGAQ